jgi:carbon storage regulator
MLVITRKPGDRIRLGDDITVTVLDVVGSTVRLGIDAPHEIPVYRHEVWEAIEAENRAAADSSVDQLKAPEDTNPS